MRLLVCVVLALCVFEQAAASPGVAEQSRSRVAPTVEIRLVPAAAEDRDAIVLGGGAQSSVPEVWEERNQAQSTGKPSGNWPQLWVRNVSVPTLSVFLPEKSKATGAAMIIAPGGAYLELAIEWEGYRVARWLNQRGIAAFVLKYRLLPTPSDPQQAAAEMAEQGAKLGAGMGHGPLNLSALVSEQQRNAMLAATEDGREAIRYVRDHAAQWKLSLRRIGIMGFSAGAGVAVGVALKSDSSSRPDLVAPIYGGLPEETVVGAGSAPAFIAVAADDPSVAYSVAVFDAWRAARIPAELHVFETGGHGFGMHVQNTQSDSWLRVFDRWLAAHGFEGSAGT